MAYWLVKSEPGAWSWDDQVRVGTDAWTGVRNHQASGYLKAMQPGDRAFFYHSVTEKRIVGIVDVVRAAYPDPTAPGERWVAVDVRAARAMPRPLGLAEIKADPRLSELPLLRQSRLSVMPIGAAEWRIMAELGGLAADEAD